MNSTHYECKAVPEPAESPQLAPAAVRSLRVRPIAWLLAATALLSFTGSGTVSVRAEEAPQPLGVAMETWDYPHEVRHLPLTIQGHDARMAYMDVSPEDFDAEPNRRTVVLMHGKNFFGAYGRTRSRRWPRPASESSSRTRSASASPPGRTCTTASTCWRTIRRGCWTNWALRRRLWSGTRWAGCWRHDLR